jgi:hypothetical protein
MAVVYTEGIRADSPFLGIVGLAMPDAFLALGAQGLKPAQISAFLTEKQISPPSVETIRRWLREPQPTFPKPPTDNWTNRAIRINTLVDHLCGKPMATQLAPLAFPADQWDEAAVDLACEIVRRNSWAHQFAAAA